MEVVNNMEGIWMVQCPNPFAKFLEKHSICAQYIMPGILHQNGVAEMHNCTLMKWLRMWWVIHLYPYLYGCMH